MGERRIINGAIYEKMDDGSIVRVADAASPPPGPVATPLPVSARTQRREERAEEASARAAAAAGRGAEAQERQAIVSEKGLEHKNIDNLMQMKNAFDALPTTKEYRVAISQLATGLQASPDPTGDNALIYAYAKAMDPGSVVRESEMGMAASGASVIEGTVANLRKQFGLTGEGQLPQKVRDRMRREMLNKVGNLNRIYSQQRHRFAEDAEAIGLDPERVIGPHDGDMFRPVVQEYNKRIKERDGIPQDAPIPEDDAATPSPSDALGERIPDPRMTASINSLISKGQWATANEILKRQGLTTISPSERQAIQKWQKANPGQPYTGADIGTEQPRSSFEQSQLGQGLAGSNIGLAGVLGAPADLSTAVINAGTGGLNALANTDIPRIEKPFLGSQHIREMMGPAIYAPNEDGSGQIARRIGESVGASAVPLAGAATTLPRFLTQLGIGAGGGAGAAAAQQAFPGNPLVEMGGEILGGGATGLGILKHAQRGAQRGIEAQIPSVDQLKREASNLYRQAENRGVAADPSQTQQLADDLRKTLRHEGQLGPAGKITDADNNTSKAFNLIEQYAGGEMRPKEMDTVRRVIADSRKSPDPSDQRLGKILLDQFDEWVRPMAPDFDEARNISSRYLQAEDLQDVRELAKASAPKFSASGLENALRTEYRGLDRSNIRGRNWFEPDVLDAIQNVSRGTTGSNIARNIGRFAPTGPVSITTGLLSAGAGGAMGGPLGAALGGSLTAAGQAGRMAATKMGLRNAEIAELIARNGGPIEQAPLVPDAFKNLAAQIAAIQQAKYLTDRP